MHRRSAATTVALALVGCGDSGSDDGGGESSVASQATTDATGMEASTHTETTGAPTSETSGAETSGDGEATTNATTGAPSECEPVAERPITSDAAIARGGVLAWIDDGAGVVWSDARHGDTEMYFLRTNALGDPIGDEQRLTNAAGSSGLPALVADAAGFAAAWIDARSGADEEVYFVRLADDGSVIGDEIAIAVAPGAGFPSVVAAGDEHGVDWYQSIDGDFEVFFARVAADGQASAPVRVTTSVGGSFLPALVWDGAQYGLAWADARAEGSGVYFTRVGADGSEIGDDSWMTPDGGGNANLMFTGEDFLLGWSRVVDPNLGGEVRARRIDVQGMPLGEEMQLVPSGTIGAALAWSATGELAVVMHTLAIEVGAASEIAFARFAPDGAPIGEIVQVSNGLVVGEDSQPRVRIAAADVGFVLTWTDDRNDASAVYFARTCP